MIKYKAEQKIELQPNMHGGKGTAEMSYVINDTDHNNKHLNLFAKMTLKPGVVVGGHAHAGKSEILYIVEGKCRYNDGTEKILFPGDAVIVAETDQHTLESADDQPMSYIVAIVLL